MKDRTRQGYARLVRDLAELDHHDRFHDMLRRAYGAMDELGQLIERARHLSQDSAEQKQSKKENPDDGKDGFP